MIINPTVSHDFVSNNTLIWNVRFTLFFPPLGDPLNFGDNCGDDILRDDTCSSAIHVSLFCVREFGRVPPSCVSVSEVSC